MTRSPLLWLGVGLVAAGIVVLAVGSALAPPRLPSGPQPLGYGPGSMMGGGMMRGPGMGPWVDSGVGPGSAGFVPGTTSSPRVVRIVATPQLRFIPDVVTVQRGETITFEVTSIGMVSHEFMVGPAAAVAADADGTPEIDDIGMMQTKPLSYTFDGPGPYAFACHVPGHYEAGMAGTIVVVQ